MRTSVFGNCLHKAYTFPTHKLYLMHRIRKDQGKMSFKITLPGFGRFLASGSPSDTGGTGGGAPKIPGPVFRTSPPIPPLSPIPPEN